MPLRKLPDRSYHNFHGCNASLLIQFNVVAFRGRFGATGSRPDQIRSGLNARRIEMGAAVQSSRAAKQSFDEMLARLIQTADEDKIPEVVAPLTPAQRASLAVFCYGRAHLNAIGLAIAATCELNSLLQAAPSNACGHAIFA